MSDISRRTFITLAGAGAFAGAWNVSTQRSLGALIYEASGTALRARPSPSWLRAGVIYEIFPRSFSSEGTLNGVTARLSDLERLGINILWLMPINPIGKVKRLGTLGSPYSVRDYYAINPNYGTKQDLHNLIREAHQRGMKVILDIVADHTSWDSVMMAHPDYYKHDQEGHLISPRGWSDVVALDYSNPKLRRYMIDMLVYWVKDFDLDGYRCDDAGDVPTDFWEQARVELDRVKPDIVMLAEASKPKLLRSAFDIDYAWPLLTIIDRVIMDGKPASAVHATVEQQRHQFPEGALHMLISDDHDTQRAIARYGLSGAIAASALMFTLEGVPLLYNGMEVGDTAASSGPALVAGPVKIFWPISALHPKVAQFYAAMLPLRKQHPALIDGKLIWLPNSGEEHVLTYLRRSQNDELLIAINLSNTPFRGIVEIASGNWNQIGFPGFKNESTAIPALALDAFEFRIFRNGPQQ